MLLYKDEEFLRKSSILNQVNAQVVRIFFINKEVLVENLLGESLVAQRQIDNGLQVFGGIENSQEIEKHFRALYENALKKEDNIQAEEKNQKKRLTI